MKKKPMTEYEQKAGMRIGETRGGLTLTAPPRGYTKEEVVQARVKELEKLWNEKLNESDIESIRESIIGG